MVEVSKKIRTRDLQTASVILDFVKLCVLKSSLDGVTIQHDWNRILTYYYQHYRVTIERLLKENGHEIENETA